MKRRDLFLGAIGAVLGGALPKVAEATEYKKGSLSQDAVLKVLGVEAYPFRHRHDESRGTISWDPLKNELSITLPGAHASEKLPTPCGEENDLVRPFAGMLPGGLLAAYPSKWSSHSEALLSQQCPVSYSLHVQIELFGSVHTTADRPEK